MLWLLAGSIFLLVVRPYEMHEFLGSIRIEFFYNVLVLLAFTFTKRKKIYFDAILTLCLVFLFSLAVSTAFALDFDHSYLKVYSYYKVALVFIVMAYCLNTPEIYEKTMKIIIVVMAIYVALSFYEFLCGRAVYRMGIYRMLGYGVTKSDPNAFATTIALSYPLIWAQIKLNKLEKLNKSFMLLVYAYMPLSLTCLMLTGSRSGFVQVIFFAVVLLLSSKRKFLFIILLSVAAVVVWVSLPEKIKNRYYSLIDPEVAPSAKSAQSSAQGRIKGLKDGVSVFLRYPSTGVGPGNIQLEYGADGTRITHQTHNLIGQVLSDLGLVGTVPFVALILLCFTRGYAGVKRARDSLRALARSDEDEASNVHSLQVIEHTLIASSHMLMILLLSGMFGHNLYRYHWLMVVYMVSVGLLILRQIRRSYAVV